MDVTCIVVTTIFIVRGRMLNPPDGQCSQYVRKLATLRGEIYELLTAGI